MLSMSCYAQPRRDRSQGESVLSVVLLLFASPPCAAVAACYWDNRKCSGADAWGRTKYVSALSNYSGLTAVTSFALPLLVELNSQTMQFSVQD